MLPTTSTSPDRKGRELLEGAVLPVAGRGSGEAARSGPVGWFLRDEFGRQVVAEIRNEHRKL